MATSPGSNRTPNGTNSENSSSSYFQKTVSLYDWWLCKSDDEFGGKRLAVAGLTSKEQQAMRVFCSAPITKQHDIFTLETTDGIVVILHGFINKARTTENGFPDEVFNHFLFGFPTHWEDYANKCFEQAVNSDIDLPNTDGGNRSTTEPVSDVTSAKDSCPVLNPSERKSIDEDEHSMKDSSRNMSEKFNVDSLSSSNIHNQVANFGSVQKKFNVHSNSNVLKNKLQSLVEPTISHHEGHPSSSSRPVDTVDNSRNDALKSLPSLLCCHRNTACPPLHTIAIQTEPLSFPGVGSPVKTDDSRSKKSKKISTGKLKTKGSTTLDRVIMSNNVLEEHSCSNMDNHFASKFDQPLLVGTSDMTLNVPKQDWDKDGIKNGSMNFLSPGATLRFIDESTACQESLSRSMTGSLFRSTAGEDRSILMQSVNHVKETVECSTVQSGKEANVIAPSTLERDTVNGTQSNSRHRKSCNPSRNVSDNQKHKPLSRCSMKHKTKELVSEAAEHLDKGKLQSSSQTAPCTGEKIDIPQAMLRASRSLKSLSGNTKTSKKNKEIAVEERGSSNVGARRKIVFDTHASTPIHGSKEKTCFYSPESLSLKRSRSGRLLLPTLDFWRNQIPVYDAGRNFTGLQEELDVEKPSKGSKSEGSLKQKRRKFT